MRRTFLTPQVIHFLINSHHLAQLMQWLASVSCARRTDTTVKNKSRLYRARTHWDKKSLCDMTVYKACFYSWFSLLRPCNTPLPACDYMETVAMAQFKEVTGHEMKWLWIPRASSVVLFAVEKNKATHGVKGQSCLYFFFYDAPFK